jgi:hypothetical protein
MKSIVTGSGVANEKFDPFVHWNKDSFFLRPIHVPLQGCLYRNFSPPDDTYLNEYRRKISVMNTVRGNMHLSQTRKIIYMKSTVVSVEEIMICAQEERESCA